MADEEKKDQPTEEVKETTKTEESKDSYTVPEKGHFQGGEMHKFIEQLEGEQGPTPDKPPVEKSVEKVEAKADKKPCIDCDDKETKPHAVLKLADGTEKVFDTKEDLDKLGMFEKDYRNKRHEGAEWERSLDKREDTLASVGDRLQGIIDLQKSNQNAEPTDEEIAEDSIDPNVLSRLKALGSKVNTLEQENVALKGSENQRIMSKAFGAIDKMTEDARVEHPIDEFVEEESGRKISKEIFGALLIAKITKKLDDKNADKSKLEGSMPEFVNQTVADLSRLQTYFKNKYSGDNGNSEEITSDFILKNHKQVADEIGQRYYTDILNKKAETTVPIARSEVADVSPEKVPSEGKKTKSLREMMKLAKDDPEISEAIEEARKGLPVA